MQIETGPKKDPDRIVPAITVYEEFELKGTSLAVLEPGAKRSIVDQYPDVGMLDLLASKGRWKVEVDAEHNNGGIAMGALQLRASRLLESGQRAEAVCYETGYVMAEGGCCGIFDGTLMNLDPQKFIELARQSLKPSSDSLTRYLKEIPASPLFALDPELERLTAERQVRKAVGNFHDGVIVQTACGDGVFKVTLGKNFANEVVSIEVDFQTIPEKYR